MSNNEWMNDPVLSGISNEKLNILTDIVENTGEMDAKQMIPYFIKASNEATKQGASFTNEETDAILNVLKQKMTPKEQQRIEMVKRLTKLMSKNKKS